MTPRVQTGFRKAIQKEDSLLLAIARRSTGSCSRRTQNLPGGEEAALLIRSDEVMEQVQQLIDLHLVKRRLTLSRCSLCNTPLREANTCEIERADYAPQRLAKPLVLLVQPL